jgi:DNA-binding response OmpR family regulator
MQNQKPGILIVEPDVPTRELYARALGRHYRVFTSGGADAVIELLRSEPIRAVVLEPAMPDGRGWALLAALRPLSAAHGISVVLCSVLDERRRAMELGATTCLVKPVLPATLVAIVGQVVERTGQPLNE